MGSRVCVCLFARAWDTSRGTPKEAASTFSASSARQQSMFRLPNLGSKTCAIATEPYMASIKRDLKTTWPFFFGFGVTGAMYAALAMGLSKEDEKKSKYMNPGGYYGH